MTVQIKCGNSSQMATLVLAVALPHINCLFTCVTHSSLRVQGPGASCLFHNESSETSPWGADYLCPYCLQDQGEISPPHSPLAPLPPALSWASLTALNAHNSGSSKASQTRDGNSVMKTTTYSSLYCCKTIDIISAINITIFQKLFQNWKSPSVAILLTVQQDKNDKCVLNIWISAWLPQHAVQELHHSWTTEVQ